MRQTNFELTTLRPCDLASVIFFFSFFFLNIFPILFHFFRSLAFVPVLVLFFSHKFIFLTDMLVQGDLGLRTAASFDRSIRHAASNVCQH